MKTCIGYIRVSTRKQNDSGLGLLAQQKALADYVQREGGTLVKTYREVESGRDNERPELGQALLHVKRSGGMLIVAKLDRLSRNVLFLALLRDSKVPFVCCDMPRATDLTVGMMAELAQWEGLRISERTREALAELRASGVKLGSARPDHWKGREDRRLEGIRKGRERGLQVRQANARKLHAELCPIILAYRAEGLSLAAVADRLNREGWLTRRKKQWRPVYVHTFLRKCEKAAE